MFARLDMPAQATVLFESASPDDPDRSSGWRFYLDQSGCYFLARNQAGLFIDSARLEGDDPALFWNEPFPTQPRACLSQEAQQQIKKTIDALKPQDLEELSAAPKAAADAETVRWTFRRTDGLHSILLPDPGAWKRASLLSGQSRWYQIRKSMSDLHDQIRAAVAAALKAQPGG